MFLQLTEHRMLLHIESDHWSYLTQCCLHWLAMALWGFRWGSSPTLPGNIRSSTWNHLHAKQPKLSDWMHWETVFPTTRYCHSHYPWLCTMLATADENWSSEFLEGIRLGVSTLHAGALTFRCHHPLSKASQPAQLGKACSWGKLSLTRAEQSSWCPPDVGLPGRCSQKHSLGNTVLERPTIW